MKFHGSLAAGWWERSGWTFRLTSGISDTIWRRGEAQEFLERFVTRTILYHPCILLPLAHGAGRG